MTVDLWRRHPVVTLAVVLVGALSAAAQAEPATFTNTGESVGTSTTERSGTSTSDRSGRSSRVDLSEGSSVVSEQPLLEAADWFLTEQELTDSRGGAPRNDLAVFTSGNAVTSYTVPNEYFNAVYDDLSASGAGDRVLMASWDSALVPLKPDADPTGATTGFHDVFADVVGRGGDVKMLVWTNLLRPHNVDVREAINSIPASPVNGARAQFIFDDRVPSISSSHHQKTLVIAANTSSGGDDHPVAFVGGLELNNDRWDTISHNNTAIRDAAGITFRHKGWIDGEVRIHGPAAKDVAYNFLQRWNSRYKPCQGLADDLLDFDNPDYDHLPPLDYASSNTTSALGRQNVQIVRTYSCKYKHYEEFAPFGETSLLQARIKAIKNARNFIYIEDQYFILVPELLDALLQMMPRLQKVVIVAHAPVGQIKLTGYEKYFYEMVSSLQNRYPNKFRLYTTKLDLDVYIHSKLVIIDDVYLSVGSANWNRRSMTSDSELNANVVDGDTIQSPDGITVNRFARDFRLRKFVEMTGVPYAELDAMRFLDAARQFDVAAANKSSLIQTLEAEYHPYYVGFTDFIRQQADRQDTCT
jgi:phospholipase D1/2